MTTPRITYPSTNCDDRPSDANIKVLVFHYTGMKNCEDALNRLTDPHAKVSSHYLISEKGEIFCLVPEDKRAWHAGISFWRGQINVNDYSVGIELENPGHQFGYRNFPSSQIGALIELSQEVISRHSISARNVVGHSDIAPSRKLDPGELFDWQRLASKGIGLWPTIKNTTASTMTELRLGVESAQVTDLQQSLALFGYQIEDTGIYDTNTEFIHITADGLKVYDGDASNPRGRFINFLRSGGENAQHVFEADASTSDRHTRTNIAGRQSLLRVLRFVRSLPGCENAYVLKAEYMPQIPISGRGESTKKGNAGHLPHFH